MFSLKSVLNRGMTKLQHSHMMTRYTEFKDSKLHTISSYTGQCWTQEVLRAFWTSQLTPSNPQPVTDATSWLYSQLTVRREQVSYSL